MTRHKAIEIAEIINAYSESKAEVTYDRKLDPDRRMIDGYDIKVTAKGKTK